MNDQKEPIYDPLQSYANTPYQIHLPHEEQQPAPKITIIETAHTSGDAKKLIKQHARVINGLLIKQIDDRNCTNVTLFIAIIAFIFGLIGFIRSF